MYPQSRRARRLSLRQRFLRYINAQVRENVLLELELLMLAFATGLNDASTYSEFRVFTANHTGNTILLAVGLTESISGNPSKLYPVHPKLVALSLSCFLLGAFIPGQLGNLIGCRRRWWLILNNIIQTILVFTAGLIQAKNLGTWNWTHGTVTSETLENDNVSGTFPGLVIVPLLAFSAGGQVCMARSMHMTEITTANATSTYVDALIDIDLFRLNNRKRNRRIFFLLTLAVGSLMGGISYQKYGSAFTLLCSAVGKLVASIMLWFNPGIEDDQNAGILAGGLEGGSDSSSEDLIPYPQKPEPVVLRDDIPRYLFREYLDFNYRHISRQIPSWVLEAGTYIRRHLSGIGRRNNNEYGYLSGYQ